MSNKGFDPSKDVVWASKDDKKKFDPSADVLWVVK